MKAILFWTGAAWSFGAAALWLYACFHKVDYAQPDPQEGWSSAAIIEDSGDRQIDFIATSKAQTYWNAWAAFATAISVVLNALAQLLERC